MILDLHVRPVVPFNARNPQHRQWFAEFQKFHTWGKCPVRFVVPDSAAVDLVTMVQRMLLEFYISEEFSKDCKPRTKAK